MDPITFTAIVAALSAGVATGAGKVVETALVDAYQGLKSTLKRKSGDSSKVVEAVERLEQKPDSETRKSLLQEEVEAAGIDQDPEVRNAAQELLDRVKSQPGGEQHIQHARGTYVAQADRSSSATVDVNRSGDNITVGDIAGSQGIAIGRQARASVTGHNMPSDVKIDAGELRATLEGLYDSLDQSELPRDKTRSAQTAAGNALDAVSEDEVRSETVVENVKKVGETIKQANVAVREGSTLWQNVNKLAQLIGPLVGGARVVTAWFGI
jgi:hypothetical protein